MKSRNYIYIVLVIIIIIFHEFILAMGYMIYTTSKYIVTDVIPETFNNIVYSGDNKNAYDKYIKNHYGIVSDTFELKSHYSRFWYVSTPFMEKEFSIQVVKGKVLTDTFSDVLFTDPKFQHLYSEWIKKEVGIDDENVELKFNRASFWSQTIGEDIYIDFSKITALDNLEDQICKNVKNIYILSNYYESGIIITDNTEENINLILNYADIIEKKLHSKIFIYKKNYIKKKNNILYISFENQNDREKNIDVKYNYDENSKFYRYHSKGSDWIKYE